MDNKTGGPAFPSHGTMGEVSHEGMTLRDYFAAKAMQALLSTEIYMYWHKYAEASYDMAEAMLAEREKRNG